MIRPWYVLKFHRGRFVASVRVPRGLDAADRLAAELHRLYGEIGWRYEVSQLPQPQVVFADHGSGI